MPHSHAVAREIGTFLIGAIVLLGCGALIWNSRGSEEQIWLIVGFVVQYFFGRAQQASAWEQATRSQPTTTFTPGPPARVEVGPPDHEEGR